eukprot:Hpha_TRINITY_DN18679_c0_g1::TRINITY_DN18679_c0_g1_i1::g.115655::m.115655
MPDISPPRERCLPDVDKSAVVSLASSSCASLESGAGGDASRPPPSSGVTPLLALQIAIIAPLLAVALFLEVCQLRQLSAAVRMSARRGQAPGTSPVSECWRSDGAALPERCFTVVLSTWRRHSSALGSVNHYRGCPEVAEVRVIWAESDHAPAALSSPANRRGAVVFADVHWPEATLNTRFLVKTPLRTSTIFSVDDDVRITCRDLRLAHESWRQSSSRESLAGFFPRVAQRSGPRAWRYRGLTAVMAWGKYSVVLTKAAFLPASLLSHYFSSAPAAVQSRELVAANRNCEDIAMMFVAANVTGAPPLYVPARDEIVDFGSWLFGRFLTGISSKQALGRHMLDRGRCLTELARIWDVPDAPSPLPESHAPGGGRWGAANGWEYISSDLWAPLAQLPLRTIVYCAAAVVLTAAASVGAYQGAGLLFRRVVPAEKRCAKRMAALLVSALALVVVVVSPVATLPGDQSDIWAGAAAPGVVSDCPADALNLTDPRDFRSQVTASPVGQMPRLRVAVVTAAYAGVVDGVSLTLNRMVEYLLAKGHRS